MRDQLSHFVIDSFDKIPTTFTVGFLVLFCIGTVVFLTSRGLKKGIRCSAGLLLVEYSFLLFLSAVVFRAVQVERTFDFTPFWSYRIVWGGMYDWVWGVCGSEVDGGEAEKEGYAVCL